MTKQDNSKPQASVAPADTAAPAPALGPAPTSGPPAPAAVLEAEAPREAKSRDGLVVASILIVSLAAAVMSFSQLGLPLPISGGVGVVTLALLMLVHRQMQKSAQIAQLQAELAHSRQLARAKPMPRTAPAPAPAPTTQTSTEARIRELSRDIGNIAPRADIGSPASVSAPGASAIASELERAVRKQPRNPQQVPQASEPATSGVASAPQNEEPAAVPQGPQAPQGDIVREQWSFRPRTDAQATVQDASAAASPVNGSAAPARASVAMTVEGDLELVQRKIKELADEVNAAEALKPKTPRVNVRPKSEPSALEDSIGALRAAAKSMRQRPSLGDFVPKFEAQAFAPTPTPVPAPSAAPSAEAPKDGFGELVIPATAERIAGSDSSAPAPNLADREPPSLDLPLPDFGAVAAPALAPRAVAITRAVEDDAVDVLLGPIVTLAEHSVTHYEMSAHLRGAAGEHLNASEDDFAAAGGDIDSQFDVARLNRAAALAARMDARDREGSLLAEFLGSSMTSRAFLQTFAQAYEARQRISAQLVLTFSQRAVDEFSPAAWQAVRDMHAFGFRLALDKVQHMRNDFAALQRSGFRFVRFDAQALLDGMATSDRFVPAEEIVQRATLAGLSIIANGIQDAATQKRLLDSGILLGQGPLFGAPREVNVDSSGSGPADQSAAA